jgi:phage baseplate assembly protein W
LYDRCIYSTAWRLIKVLSEIPVYSDLDLSFRAHPLTGDLIPKINTAAVMRSIKSIFEMNSFDIPFNPNVGPSIKDLLFELTSQVVASAIQTRIGFVFKKYEQRANLIHSDVTPTPDGKGYNITVIFNIVAVGSSNTEFSFYVARIH